MKFKLIIVFVFTLLCVLLQAQTKVVRGTVFDNNEALPGATVRIEGTQRGTATDANGKYIIIIPANMKTVLLNFSFLGKKTKSIKWNGEKILDVKLKDDAAQLKELVVTARPNINEIDIRSRTGSVLEVDMALVKSKPVASLGLALQGNLPGLQIINTGELGSKPQVRVRGTSSFRKGDLPNEPLYVLDGQVITPETFFTLNPEDIKGIKVLKDAAATALYGIKAANGVLEISSTRGFNIKRAVSYSMKTGITFRGEKSAPLMESKEKLELERLLENPVAPGYLYNEKYIRKTNPFNPNVDKLIERGRTIIDSLSQINTDWYRKLLHANIYQTHTLSMRGGDENTSYYTSLGFMYQGGQLKGNDHKRFSARISLDQQLDSNMVLGLSVNGSMGKTDTPNGSKYSALELVYKLNPYETEETKNLFSYPKMGYPDLFNQFKRVSTDKTVGATVSFNGKITPELEVSAVAGLTFLLNENLSIVPSTAFEERKSGIPPDERGKLTQSKNTTTTTTNNLRVTYNKIFGKHDITLGGNTDYYSTLIDNITLTGRGLFGNVMSAAGVDNSIDGISRARVGGQKELVRNVGFGVVAGYTFDQTYDFFATYKLDASSVLPKNKRNNTAWALGGGWDLKKYSFANAAKWLKSIKLRASYGYTASLQGVSPASTVPTFGYTNWGYDNVRGLQLLALPNLGLQAEKNIIYDYGVRASAGNTDVEVSIYKRTTYNALLEVPIPSSNGFVTQLRNVGTLKNSGLDVSLSQQLISTSDCLSRMRINLSYNQNKVIDLYGVPRIYTVNEEGAELPDYEVGQSIDALFGLNSQGINPKTGAPTFITHDGIERNVFYDFKREDFVYLGRTNPPVTGGIFYSLSYKNLEIDLDLYYTLGGKRKYAYNYVRTGADANFNAVKGQVDEMWFKEGDENKRYPSPFILDVGNKNLMLASTRTIASTDMIRLNSVSIRYRLPSVLMRKMDNIARYITCGLQAANLFTLKRFSEADPESGSIVAPLQPVLTLSLNVTL